jgi:hypothetical protein
MGLSSWKDRTQGEPALTGNAANDRVCPCFVDDAPRLHELVQALCNRPLRRFLLHLEIPDLLTADGTA